MKRGEARPWSRTAADPTEILFDRFNPSGVARERERERGEKRSKVKYLGKREREGGREEEGEGKYVSKGYVTRARPKNLYI